MNIDGIAKVLTVFGASIAALTGIVNLSLQFRGKRDRFAVRLGSASPSVERETMLRVVSMSDHPVSLVDWGFLSDKGTFQSIRMDWETGDLSSDEIVQHGFPKLESFGANFESGYIRREEPVGAFAISATQDLPKVYFSPAAPRLLKLKIRLRLLWNSNYLAH